RRCDPAYDHVLQMSSPQQARCIDTRKHSPPDLKLAHRNHDPFPGSQHPHHFRPRLIRLSVPIGDNMYVQYSTSIYLTFNVTIVKIASITDTITKRVTIFDS